MVNMEIPKYLPTEMLESANSFAKNRQYTNIQHDLKPWLLTRLPLAHLAWPLAQKWSLKQMMVRGC
jgi:hypothetical protein